MRYFVPHSKSEKAQELKPSQKGDIVGTKATRTKIDYRFAKTWRFDAMRGTTNPYNLLALLRDSGLLVLCAEPGCLYTGFAEEVLKASQADRDLIFYRNFSRSTSSNAVDAVTRLSREVARKARGVAEELMVALDFVPPADEYEVTRMAASIAKMRDAGALVLVTILPEARQLAEGLNEFVMLGTDDLCDRSVYNGSSVDGGPRNGAWDLTRGIPLLLQALRSAPEWNAEKRLPSAYSEAVRDLIELGLRPCLHEEELSLRLAVTLLGSGSLEDLNSVLGIVDNDLLEDLSTWAPFYGLDLVSRTFDCVSDYSNGWMGLDAPLLRGLIAGHEALASSCAELLGSEGDLERLAAMLPLLSPEVRARLVVSRGPELIDCGFLSLVKDAAASFDELGMGRTSSASHLKRVVRAMSQVRLADSYFDLKVTEGHKLDQTAMLERSLLRTRSLLRGGGYEAVHMGIAGSSLDARLRAHEKAVALMRDGRFREAMQLLMAHGGVGEIDSVSSCLIALDMEISRVMSCDTRWGDKSVLDACKAFLVPRGYEGLNGYLWLAEAIIEGLAGGDRARVSAIETSAMRAGESVARAVAQLAGAAMELRRKPSAYSLAGASAAQTACEELGLTYAAKSAALLKGVARFCLGEQPRFYEFQKGDGLAVLGKVVFDAMHESFGDLVPAEEVVYELPVNELWLLILLSETKGDFAEGLEDQIPTEWRRGIEVARRNCLRAPVPAETEPLGLSAAGTDAKKTVRVNLLGEFSVWAGGARVPEWTLEKRSAKSVLEHLVLQANHLSGRLRLAAMVWPEAPSEKNATQRLYQTTSAIRKALKIAGYEEELFISNKATKVIALVPEHIRCDVDDFIECAKGALEGTGDARVCEQALRAESLYAGDLCILPAANSPFLIHKREELRVLYADAMVAGGEAALRLGKKRHAYRLASNALLIDDLREDAAILLIRALRASGRENEARSRYMAYVERLAKRLGKLPSMQVQEAMREPIPGLEAAKERPRRAQRFA